jgi:hypothetical protein
MITNTAVVNQDGGHLMAESYTFVSGCQFNGTAGTVHLSARGSVPANQYITMNDAGSYFYNFMIDAGVNGFMNTSAFELVCDNLMDIYGSFNVNGEDIQSDYLDVNGTLKINSGIIEVVANGPYFHSGSTFIMGGGTIWGGSTVCFYSGVNDMVTGGMIMVNEDLINNNETFSPSGGIFEFIGTLPSQIIGKTTFYNLQMAKQGTILENGSDGAGVDFSCTYLVINSGTLELNVPCTVAVSNTLDIESGGILNADDGAIVIEVGHDWWNENNATGYFLPGTLSTVKLNGSNSGMIQSVRERARFQNLVVDMSGIYVIPDATFQSIHCYNLDINSGTLKIGSYRVDVDNNMTITGNLTMDDVSDTLNIGNNMTWNAGSTDNITAGVITVDYILTFENGTSAQLGTGNTVVFNNPGSSFIYCKDADASIGNVDVCKAPSTASDTYIHGSSSFPVLITGNLTVRNGNQFHVQTRDLNVQGWLSIETGAELDLLSGGDLVNTLGFVHNGSLAANGGNVLLHGLFEQSSGSVTNITSGSLVNDATYSAGTTVDMDGSLTLSGGALEITNNSIYFTSTFNGNILGGNIRTGASFYAINDVFQPTGGKVELIGTNPAGISLDDDSFFYDLVCNKPGITMNATSGFSVKHEMKVTTGSTFNTNGMGINLGP